MWVAVFAADQWAVIGSLAGVVGIAVAVGLFWLQGRKERKALGCEVTERALVRIGREAQGKVEIRYEGELVRDVHLVQVVLRNTGKAPILRDDYDRPMVLRFEKGAGLLPSTFSAVGDPPEMAPSASLGDGTITVEPTLLNPGDRITLSVLVSDYAASADPVDVDVRIAGIAEIRHSIDRPVGALAWSAVLGASDVVKPIVSGLAVVVVGIAIVPRLVNVLFSKEDTRITLTSGSSLCGEVLSRNGARLSVSLKGTGEVRSVPISDVRRIKDNAC